MTAAPVPGFAGALRRAADVLRVDPGAAVSVVVDTTGPWNSALGVRVSLCLAGRPVLEVVDPSYRITQDPDVSDGTLSMWAGQVARAAGFAVPRDAEWEVVRYQDGTMIIEWECK